MVKKAAVVLLLVASTAMWVGCVTRSSHVLYAALPQSSQIVAYREDPNSGILTQLQVSPITAGPGVQSLVVHPSGQFLYAANSGENDVSLFTISSNGALSETGSRQKVGISPTLVAMDPGGKYLFVGDSGSNDIWVFSITVGSSGSPPTLTQIGTPFPAGLSPLNMKASAAGFVYVSGAGPQAGVAGYLEVLSLNPAATTSPLSIVQIAQPGVSPYGLTISPDGSYLYTGNLGDNTISEFSIGSDGTLTTIPGSPIGETFTGPASVLVDNSGKYLYVANQQSSGNIAAYSVGMDGALSLLTTSPFPTNAQPNFLATDVKGNYLFVGNLTKPVIESFNLASTGVLTEVATYPLASNASSIVISP